MPSFSVSNTVVRKMWTRSIAIVNGPLAPLRSTFRLTSVWVGPRIMLEIAFLERPLRGLPSTWVMRSFFIIPALAAGFLGNTSETTTTPSLIL